MSEDIYSEMDTDQKWINQYISKATVLQKIADRLRAISKGAAEGKERDGLILIFDLLRSVDNGVTEGELTGNSCTNKDICPFFEAR